MSNRAALKRLLTPAARLLLQPLVGGLAALTAPGVKALHKFGFEQQAQRIFARHGFHLVRRHFYGAVPDEADLPPDYWTRESALVGLEMRAEAALKFMREDCAPYFAEFRQMFPIHAKDGANGFHLANGSFMMGDAHLYYALIRHFRPARVVEIGAGMSTYIAAAASLKNAQDGTNTHLTAIEPYPSPALKAGFPGLNALIEQKVQAVDLATFTALQANDILFIDSTHVLREGSDVLYEYGEILPRLAPGVLVHVHDVALPYPYSQTYFKMGYHWNEQYLLQAFLTYNHRFEVVWPGGYLAAKHPQAVLEAFPETHEVHKAFPMAGPSSFWMRVRDSEKSNE
ncbi:MAG: class I SAM-dependent methyltransferase [bacterium]|nr:class I SAM-dependent methyltransferase [bacterium]